MHRISRTVLKNSAVGMLAHLAIKVLSFGFTVLIVRQLGTSDYGQYSAVVAFGSIFLFISDLGLSPYMVRQIARWRDQEDAEARIAELFSSVVVLRLLLSLVAGVVTVMSAWLTGRPSMMVAAVALNSVNILLYAVQGTSESLLAGFERLDLAAGAKVANQLVFVALGGAALLLGLGYYSLIIAAMVGILAMTWICIQGIRRLGVRPGRVVMQSWPVLLRASLPFGILGLTLGLSYRFDTVLLNIFRNDYETGLYNAAYNLVFTAAVFSNVINTSLYPSLARQSVSDPASLPAIYDRVLRYLLITSLPIAFGCWALAGDVVSTLFGAEYQESLYVLQIVIWVVPFMYVSEFLGYTVVVQGDEAKVARSVVISTAVNVTMNLMLVPVYGYVGAAIMTVLTEVVLVGQYVWLLRDSLRAMQWKRSFLHPLLASAAMGLMAVMLRPYLPFLLNAALCGAVYLGLLLWMRVIGKDELQFARNLRAPAKATSVS
jgi:O-antigen/teichoic acid export membrane protein